MSILQCLYHVAIVMFLVFSYVYLQIKVEPWLQVIKGPPTFGGDAKFLTMWDLLFQLFYFCFCCVTDLIATSGSHSPIGQKFAAFRDWFLAALAFPIGMLVVVTFWSIYAIDRNLIFPESLDAVFPAWLNHALHTYVLPLLLLDMALVPHDYPSRKRGLLGTLVFCLGYLLWVLYLGFVRNIWVYPFFQVLEGIYFPLFFFVMTLVVASFYLLGEKLNSFLGRFSRPVEPEKID